jgi:4'-phosphopantetheinyl transferase EntD
VPDAYGRPRVKSIAAVGPTPAAIVRVPQGPAIPPSPSRTAMVLAVALASPRFRTTLVGIDLESLTHRREDFEAIAFSPDERRLLAALPPDLRQEWALRMWCAKEAVGKALGRGLSAGLLAFHITRAETASGVIEVELRDGALEQFPQLRGKSVNMFTRRVNPILCFLRLFINREQSE